MEEKDTTTNIISILMYLRYIAVTYDHNTINFKTWGYNHATIRICIQRKIKIMLFLSSGFSSVFIIMFGSFFLFYMQINIIM